MLFPYLFPSLRYMYNVYSFIITTIIIHLIEKISASNIFIVHHSDKILNIKIHLQQNLDQPIFFAS